MLDLPYAAFILIFLGVAALSVAVTLGVYVYRLIRRQLVLRYSITLLELKTNKIPFYILDILLIILFLFAIIATVEPPIAFDMEFFETLGMDEPILRAAAGEALLIVFAVLCLSVTLTFTKCAIVDRGVHIDTRFLDWHHVYDYFVDEENCTVILSSNRNGPLTLQGTTPPLKFNPNDIEKLKFIIAKNKNKFIPRYELR